MFVDLVCLSDMLDGDADWGMEEALMELDLPV